MDVFGSFHLEVWLLRYEYLKVRGPARGRMLFLYHSDRGKRQKHFIFIGFEESDSTSVAMVQNNNFYGRRTKIDNLKYFQTSKENH